ncbi:MAG: hypothetical protein GC164_14150 [Phycisphaera sp.]|nr:hypothetical protein [Phycisphaera sp.]
MIGPRTWLRMLMRIVKRQNGLLSIPWISRWPALERSLGLYYDQYPPFDQSQPLGLEKQLQLKLGRNGLRFVGFVDRLTSRPHGTLEVHDYKTPKSLPVGFIVALVYSITPFTGVSP